VFWDHSNIDGFVDFFGFSAALVCFLMLPKLQKSNNGLLQQNFEWIWRYSSDDKMKNFGFEKVKIFHFIVARVY